jgi:phosphatidylglycerophosphate synthase
MMPGPVLAPPHLLDPALNLIVARSVLPGRTFRHGGLMLSVHQGRSAGLVAQLVVLAVLAGTAGLGPAGWVAGLAYGTGVVALLSSALARSGTPLVGPADLVTLLRSALVGGVAALVADSVSRPLPTATLALLAGVALVLDGVDGRVARRTGTASDVGARFDMEVDSFLVLLLSVSAARSLGVWVLAIGSVRYVRLLAGRVLPWLRRPVPPRYWCKVVAVVQGVVLTAAAADVLPPGIAVLALVVVALLLAESFGREVAGLWRTRRVAPAPGADAAVVGSRHG